MSCVLATGAAGLIGQALVRRLLDDGILGRHVHRLVLSDTSLNIYLRTRGWCSKPAISQIGPFCGVW